MAYLGLKMLHDLNQGRIKMVRDWRQARSCPLPALVDTGAVVTRQRTFAHSATERLVAPRVRYSLLIVKVGSSLRASR